MAVNQTDISAELFDVLLGKVLSHFYDMFFFLWKEGLDADLRREVREEHPSAELWV